MVENPLGEEERVEALSLPKPFREGDANADDEGVPLTPKEVVPPKWESEGEGVLDTLFTLLLGTTDRDKDMLLREDCDGHGDDDPTSLAEDEGD
jgi:hypothetical protein